MFELNLNVRKFKLNKLKHKLNLNVRKFDKLVLTLA